MGKEVIPPTKKSKEKKEKKDPLNWKEKIRRKQQKELMSRAHQNLNKIAEEFGFKTKKKPKKAPEKNKTPDYVKESLKGEEYFQNYFNRCVERATGKSVGALIHSEMGRIRLRSIKKAAAEYWSKNHPDPSKRNDTETFNKF